MVVVAQLRARWLLYLFFLYAVFGFFCEMLLLGVTPGIARRHACCVSRFTLRRPWYLKVFEASHTPFQALWPHTYTSSRLGGAVGTDTGKAGCRWWEYHFTVKNTHKPRRGTLRVNTNTYLPGNIRTVEC